MVYMLIRGVVQNLVKSYPVQWMLINNCVNFVWTMESVKLRKCWCLYLQPQKKWCGTCPCIQKFGLWTAQQVCSNATSPLYYFLVINNYNSFLFYLKMFNLNQGTNRQKRELFVVAVRSASGVTLPVNLTIIPSAQKWVFNAIYQLAFPSLYSSNVCSMNRLVLTDEDESEYAPFQSAIVTMPEFRKSNVMLCTFHGIWQSFKKDLYPLLDDNPNGQLLGMSTLFL